MKTECLQSTDHRAKSSEMRILRLLGPNVESFVFCLGMETHIVIPVYGRQSRECHCGLKTNLGDKFQDNLDYIVRFCL